MNTEIIKVISIWERLHINCHSAHRFCIIIYRLVYIQSINALDTCYSRILFLQLNFVYLYFEYILKLCTRFNYNKQFTDIYLWIKSIKIILNHYNKHVIIEFLLLHTLSWTLLHMHPILPVVRYRSFFMQMNFYISKEIPTFFALLHLRCP